MYEEGTLLADKYRIDRVLGRGGMGMVVAATHVQLNQPVALKFLLDEMLAAPQLVERFLREARASARLRGEHVCKVSDVGTLESGAPYMVMELLEGRDLASLLAGDGPMPAALVVDYLLQTCLGVGEAHAQGIVHRDLKPANLFLTHRPDGSPLIKVLDFGIAKATREKDLSLTRTSALLGSPAYMSPEQLRSTRDADTRSDIWSLGAIMYELVAGHVPFTAETITALTLRVAMDPVPPLEHAFGGFEHVIYRCLEKEPSARYQDVAQLAEALAPFGESRAADTAAAVARVLRVSSPVTAPRTAPAAARVTPPTMPAMVRATTLSTSSGATQEPAPRKRGRALAAAVVAIGVVAGGGAVVVFHGGSSARIAPGAPTAAPTSAFAPAAPLGAPVSAPKAATAAGSAAAPAGSGSAAVAAAAVAGSAAAGSAAAPANAAKPRHHKQSGPAVKPTVKSQEDYGENRY